MAKNDFSAEAAANDEEKCLCVLVLDVSGSMGTIVGGVTRPTGQTQMIDGKLYNIVEGGTTRIDELNKGIQSFYKEIAEDDSLNQKLELSLITFNNIVTTVQEPALVENFTMPTLSAKGSTAMVDAVNEAIDKVQARKDWYKSTAQNYYRSWIILITDGEPDEGQDVDGLSCRIKTDTKNRKYVFLPVGVEGANMSILNQITGTIPTFDENTQTTIDKPKPAISLKVAEFKEFFEILSNSFGREINREESWKDSVSSI